MSARNLPPFAVALKQRQENQNIPPKAPLPHPQPMRQFAPEYDDDYAMMNDSKDFMDDNYDDIEPEVQPKPKRQKKQHQKQKIVIPEEDEHDYLAEIEDYRNLVFDLQKKNGDLEKQIADLTTENTKLQGVQQDLIKERQISDDYFKQIDELKDALREEQVKSKGYNEHVTQLESIVQSKNQQIEAKESIIHSINIAYNQMVSEYQASALLVGTMTGQIRQYTKQISELETQIAELKSAARTSNLNKRYDAVYDNMYQNDFKNDLPNNDFFRQPVTNNFNDFPINNNNNNFNDLPPAGGFDDINQPNTFNDFYKQENGNQGFNDFNANPTFDDQSFLPNHDPINNLPPPSPIQNMPVQPATPAMKRAALIDNINFGDSREPSFTNNELDLQGMSAQEMKDLLSNLQKERDEIERILNKAPPKGKLLAHVNREKEEKERELDGLVKQISKIKYRLKVIKAL